LALATEKTLSDLEWSRVKGAVEERCVSAAGKRSALAMPFAESRVELDRMLAESREARAALDRGEPLPIYGARDVEPAAARLKMGGVLSAPELRDLGVTLGSARVLRRYLSTRSTAMPALSRLCSTDPQLDEVEDEITGSFDADGTLADHASPRLRELRVEHRQTRGRMVARLEELMRRYESVLSDTFWTEREGRYVLPVRTDAHERFPGIVHTTSNSGATLFVEPRALIPLGNRLKVLDGEVRREEELVYERLTGLLHERLPSVLFAVEALAQADRRAAIAKLARDVDLVFVEITAEPLVDLLRARHPLLVLDGAQVVPSDLTLSPRSVMVISGPNAGGKTVALKTMGLAALMLRAGLPIACAEGSRMGAFDQVLTDVGDDQSLQKNLSTFSAHIRNLASLLDAASPGSLVLLDEVATGTDPREGEALAAAILDGLCVRGAAVACTTHYEGLKALALGDTRFVNASVGFDLSTMSPTFRLAVGVPGGSSAFAVARRFGIPEGVLARAERFLSREDHDFERMVSRLDDERRALELARAAADDARRESEARSARLAAEIEALREKGKHAATRETDDLVAAVRRAREELRAVHARLRGKKVDEGELRELTRAVDRVASQVAVGGDLEPVLPSHEGRSLVAAEIRRGARVHVPRLRADAEVVEVMSGGQLRVAAGSLKLVVSSHEVRSPREEPAKKKARVAEVEGPAAPLEVPIATSDNTCDLRGLRADDATRLSEQFLDRALNVGRKVVFLVHGHGTGALREAVRSTLANSPYVAKLRPGEMGEGGDGVTVIWLR
jgi:DNA mismatch repair protein MutS2